MDINLKEEWLIFCRGLYANILAMERKIDGELEESFKTGKPFSDRQRLLGKARWIMVEKPRIEYEAKNKVFSLQDDTAELIELHGVQKYFRLYESI